MRLRTALLAMGGAVSLLPIAASAQDVVMRRPLPIKNGVVRNQDDCMLSNTCSTPIPDQTTPDPGTVTPTPTTPSPTPTTGQDDDGGVPSWQVSAWSGGGACGTTSTITRTVTCGVTPVTYDPDTGEASYGQTRSVDESVCVNRGAGQRPAESRTGDDVNCRYEYHKTGDGDWTLPPSAPAGDTATCSAVATRTAKYICLKDGSFQVAMSFCNLPPVAGKGPTPRDDAERDPDRQLRIL